MFQVNAKSFSKLYASAILFGILAILAVFSTLKSLWQKRRIFEFAKNYKGYKFYPIIGNNYHLIGSECFTAMQGIIKKFGVPCNLWLGHDYYYVTTDASEVKVILTHPSTLAKMNIFKALKFGFGNSLVVAEVDTWKIRRKFFAKCFSQTILNSFVPIFYKNSNILLDVLKNVEGRDLFDILARNSFDNFCENIIGKNYNAQQHLENKFVEWLDQVQTLGSRQLVNYLIYPTIPLILLKEVRRMLVLILKAKYFGDEILNDKRKAFMESSGYIDDGRFRTVVDAMLQEEGKKFTSEEIFQELSLFLVGATDTSSNTMAFTFMFLGMHPEIQELVYKEVSSVVEPDQPIGPEHLPNLKYTERVILESMRLVPATPYMGRQATEDINVGNKVIPKGANIFIPAFNIHRNEKYWSDPLRFDPDRFLPEEVAKREPFAFIPFSGGPRGCLGKTYALMLMKTTVANVIKNYEVSSKYKSVEELRFTTCITIKTTHPLDCKFKARSNT